MTVDEYLKQQESPQHEICQKLRQIIIKTFPGVKEEMKWGVPAYDHGRYYFVALKNHVNLGFSIIGLSTEERANFRGAGKTMRHLEFHALEEIDEQRVIHLIRMVKEKASP